MDLHERQRAAECIAGDIRWNGAHGQTRCPLGHSCVVHVDDNPAPNFSCCHEKCQDDLLTWSIELRSTCGGTLAVDVTPEQREAKAASKRVRVIEHRIRRYVLPRLKEQPGVAEEEWIEASPAPITWDVQDGWKYLLVSLFNESDIIWIGGPYDTGEPHHIKHFKTVAQWMSLAECPGPQVSRASFYREEFIRSPKRARSIPYWVLESDDLTIGEWGSVLLHIAKTLTLRAVVHTGGKSLHAWFDSPVFVGVNTEERRQKRDEFFALLIGLGADKQHFVNVTTRCPGWFRTDEKTGEKKGWQRLIYLNPKYT